MYGLVDCSQAGLKYYISISWFTRFYVRFCVKTQFEIVIYVAVLASQECPLPLIEKLCFVQ